MRKCYSHIRKFTISNSGKWPQWATVRPNTFCEMRFCEMRSGFCEMRLAFCEMRFAFCGLRFAKCVLYGGPLGPFRANRKFRISRAANLISRAKLESQIWKSCVRKLFVVHIYTPGLPKVRAMATISPPWSPSLQLGSTNDLITHYFTAGHRYKTILQFLCLVHGVVMSMRQFKRILKHLGLRRRMQQTYGRFPV